MKEISTRIQDIFMVGSVGGEGIVGEQSQQTRLSSKCVRTEERKWAAITYAGGRTSFLRKGKPL